LAVVGDVLSRPADAERLPGGAAGRLDAHDLLERRALIDAQERAVLLGGRELAFLHEGNTCEVRDVADVRRRHASAVELRPVIRPPAWFVGGWPGEPRAPGPRAPIGRIGLVLFFPVSAAGGHRGAGMIARSRATPKPCPPCYSGEDRGSEFRLDAGS